MLKYLFEATFKDNGSSYKQTQADKSRLDPKKRSAFYDIVQVINQVKTFKLIKDSIFPNKDTYEVNLETGEFIINGKTLEVGWSSLEQNPPHVPIPPLELIYFRQVKQHVNIAKQERIGQEVRYFFGWKDSTGNIRTLGIE